jgi:hypothetical protein
MAGTALERFFESCGPARGFLSRAIGVERADLHFFNTEIAVGGQLFGGVPTLRVDTAQLKSVHFHGDASLSKLAGDIEGTPNRSKRAMRCPRTGWLASRISVWCYRRAPALAPELSKCALFVFFDDLCFALPAREAKPFKEKLT